MAKYQVYLDTTFIGEYDRYDLMLAFGSASTYEDVGDEVHIRHPANRDKVMIARPKAPEGRYDPAREYDSRLNETQRSAARARSGHRCSDGIGGNSSNYR